ncbi:MAG TPA: inositol monophosphatase family protein [Planctomycetota bacterium]
MSELADRVLEVACEAGRAAARVCRAVLTEAPANPEAMSKLGKEPVTVADYGSQAVILRAIAAAFPDHGVIAEEGSAHLRASAGDKASAQIVRVVGEALGEPADFEQVCAWIDHQGSGGTEFTWCVDPIDGTKGFLRREQFAVAIGLLRGGKPWAGVLVCPHLPVHASNADGPRGVLFAAVAGHGTTVAPLSRGAAIPARASEHTGADRVRVLGSVESEHGDPALVRAVIDHLGLRGGMVRIDSQAKYACVARGDAEVYLRPRSRPDYREKVWDHAAGVIVCEEAGGKVTDLDGKPLDFTFGRTLQDNRGVLATNGYLHTRVLASLRVAEAAG